jgi:alkylation response protein AidB-like acyl-CoA dehydrogenase
VIARTTLDTVRALQPTIAAQSAVFDERRGLPEDVVAVLREAGCCRLLTPEWKSGTPPAYPDALEVVEAIAEADASAAWVVAQGALAQIILGYLPRTSQASLYKCGADLVAAGAFAPKGRATRVTDGWEVSGRWPFVSGCEHADWIYVHCLVVEDRRVVSGPGGQPQTRLVVFPRDAVTILDTWDSNGLRGSGSHDVELRHVHCPDSFSCNLVEQDGAGDGLQSLPLMDSAGMLIAAVAVGTATGALRDAADVAARGRRPTFSACPLAEDPIVQEQLGRAHMHWHAGRTLLIAQASLLGQAATGRPLAAVERASLRATCRAVTDLATAAVDACHLLVRSASVPRSASVTRRWRDIHTATQHAWNGFDATQQLGAVIIRDRLK